MNSRQRKRRGRRRRHASAGAGLGLGAALALAPAAQADVEAFTVDKTTDDAPAMGTCTVATNDCSLRQAVALANDFDPATDTDQILFQSGLSGTITLTSGVLSNYDSVQIDGSGATITVNGNAASQILTFGEPSALSSLTLTNADTPAINQFGGAIYSGADLTISDAVITGNTGDSGAGIAASGGSLTLQSTTVSGNTATYGGGGVAISYGTLMVEESTISGNSSGYNAGLYVRETPTTIRNSTISGNTATVGGGGGIFINQGTGDTAAIENTTIADNDAATYGGGVSRIGIGMTPATTTLSNTLVADDTAPTGPDVNGAVDAGFSLIEDTSGATITEDPADSNLTGVDPQLVALGPNGGPTMTHALPATSPAVDCGSSGGETTDQRGAGFTRPVDLAGRTNSTTTGADGADIGAFELQSGAASGACTNNPPPAVSIDDETVAEGDVGQAAANFTVSLDHAFSEQVTVDFDTSDGTAAAPGDYTPTSDTVTFAPGDTSEPATVQVNGDTTDEPDETFNVDLSNATNATIADNQGTGTITDDDLPPAMVPPVTPVIPTIAPAPAPAFDLKAAIQKCKKKFRKGSKARKKCIRKARARA